jgi:hypothetical protein
VRRGAHLQRMWGGARQKGAARAPGKCVAHTPSPPCPPAFASMVLPVPGGPNSITPCGGNGRAQGPWAASCDGCTLPHARARARFQAHALHSNHEPAFLSPPPPPPPRAPRARAPRLYGAPYAGEELWHDHGQHGGLLQHALGLAQARDVGPPGGEGGGGGGSAPRRRMYAAVASAQGGSRPAAALALAPSTLKRKLRLNPNRASRT